MDAHAEDGVLVLLGRAFRLVVGSELRALVAIDLDGVMPVVGEDHESVGIVAVIVRASAVGEQLVGGGESPGADDRRPDDGRGLRSGGERDGNNESDKEEEFELHVGKMRGGGEKFQDVARDSWFVIRKEVVGR